MQLFVLDYNPEDAVKSLSDIHLRKMCLETAQILSSIMVNKGVPTCFNMPKPFNLKHPVIKAINTSKKINWLLEYNHKLHDEYLYRFGKSHSYHSLVDLYKSKLLKHISEKTEKSDLDFAKDFKDVEILDEDIVEAYRKYYKYKKSIIKQWKYTNREEPTWLKEMI